MIAKNKHQAKSMVKQSVANETYTSRFEGIIEFCLELCILFDEGGCHYGNIPQATTERHKSGMTVCVQYSSKVGCCA